MRTAHLRSYNRAGSIDLRKWRCLSDRVHEKATPLNVDMRNLTNPELAILLTAGARGGSLNQLKIPSTCIGRRSLNYFAVRLEK